MSAKIRIQCPGCQAQYSVPSGIGEKRLRCKKCDRRFTISEARNADSDTDIIAAEIVSPAPVPPTAESQYSTNPVPVPAPAPFGTPINNPYLSDTSATHMAASPVVPAIPQHKSSLMMVPAILGAIIFSLAMAVAAWMYTFTAVDWANAQAAIAQNEQPTARAVAPAARSIDQTDRLLEAETKKPHTAAPEEGPTPEEFAAERQRKREIERNQEIERRHLAEERQIERRKKYEAERTQRRQAKAETRLAEAKAKQEKTRQLRLTPAAGEKPTENLIMRVREASWGVNDLVVTDDRYLAIADNETVRIFDWRNKLELSEYNQFEALGRVEAIAMTNDGKKLIVGGTSGRIELFNVDHAGQLVANPTVLQGHEDDIVELALNEDASKAVSVDDKRNVILWDLVSQKEISRVNDFSRHEIEEVRFSNDSKQFAVTDGGLVVHYLANDGRELRKVELDAGYAHAAAFSKDESLIAVSASGLKVFKRTGKQVWESRKVKGVQWTLQFADKKHLYSCGNGSVAKINATNGEIIKNFEIPDARNIKKISISPDGSKIAVTGATARADVFLLDVSQ